MLNKLNIYQFLSIDGVKEGGNENLEGVQEDKAVKRFYKKWKFWVISIFTILLIYLANKFWRQWKFLRDLILDNLVIVSALFAIILSIFIKKKYLKNHFQSMFGKIIYFILSTILLFYFFVYFFMIMFWQ